MQLARFSLLLAQHRDRAELSQRKLAEASGVVQPTIAALESGAAAPSRAAINRLADALGLKDEEREQFLLSGLLARAAPEVQRWALGKEPL